MLKLSSFELGPAARIALIVMLVFGAFVVTLIPLDRARASADQVQREPGSLGWRRVRSIDSHGWFVLDEREPASRVRGPECTAAVATAITFLGNDRLEVLVDDDGDGHLVTLEVRASR